MLVDERILKVLAEHQASAENSAELGRLQEFLRRMKEAGLVRKREYDIPQPDTLGRSSFTRAKQTRLHPDSRNDNQEPIGS